MGSRKKDGSTSPANSFARLSALCLAGGTLLALALPRPGQGLLAWFAPALLFYSLRRAGNYPRAAGMGFLFGFVYCLVSLWWLYTTVRFAGVPVPISLLAVAALAGVLALLWAVFGVVARRASETLPAAALPWAWALSWTALESAGAHWTPRVAVDLLSYTQWNRASLIQVGAVLGPHGLGCVVMLWNAALAEVKCKESGCWGRRNLAAAAAAVTLCWAYGTAVLGGREAPGSDLRVEILQPNIDQYQKWDRRYEDRIRGSFDGLLSRERERRPDLVLWPEAALPGWIEDPANSVWVSGWAKRLQAPMLVGTISSFRGKGYNSAVYVNAAGEIEGIYHKRQLVPFGEFVPLRSWFEGWIGILAQMGEFGAGERRQKLLKTRLGPLAVSICYEATFPHLLRLDSARGARIFANLTNDGWYKNTSGPLQHFYTNMFRAVENRVTVLRAANTGISAVIDPYGVITVRTEIEKRALLRVDVPKDDPFPRRSFYARHGDWFGFLAILLTVGWLAWPVARKLLGGKHGL